MSAFMAPSQQSLINLVLRNSFPKLKTSLCGVFSSLQIPLNSVVGVSGGFLCLLISNKHKKKEGGSLYIIQFKIKCKKKKNGVILYFHVQCVKTLVKTC